MSVRQIIFKAGLNDIIPELKMPPAAGALDFKMVWR